SHTAVALSRVIIVVTSRASSPDYAAYALLHYSQRQGAGMATSAYPDTQLLIANKWVGAASGKTLDVRNPATGQTIGTVAHAGIADLDRALAAAQSGFQIWRDASVYERAGIMRRAAALL